MMGAWLFCCSFHCKTLSCLLNIPETLVCQRMLGFLLSKFAGEMGHLLTLCTNKDAIEIENFAPHMLVPGSFRAKWGKSSQIL